MIPKKNLLISAALTAFMLVMLAGVTMAFKQQPVTENPVVTESSVETIALQAPTQVPFLSPQDAAQVAAKFLGRDDLYSVETSTWNNLVAYKVTFSSGDIVYVSTDGQILENVAPQPVVVTTSNRNQGSGGGNGDRHEDHEDRDHEEEHDDADD